MKPTTRTILITSALSVTLLFFGLYSWGTIFTTLLPVAGDIYYVITNVSEPFRQSLVFALTLALTPVFTLLVWKLAPILSNGKRLWSIGVILAGMILFVMARREMIRYQANHLHAATIRDYSNPAKPEPIRIESNIPASSLNFEWYAFAGMTLGCIISFFWLRQKALLRVLPLSQSSGTQDITPHNSKP